MKLYEITFMCLIYTLAICHLALFLYEFFPVTTNLRKFGDVVRPPSHINGTSLNPHKHYKTRVKRVVFMVIDGLRNDFINGTNTPFLKENFGCHVTAKVETPTVTMPRIKAMTTGTLPQYIDILLNFESDRVLEDSWLQRAKDSGKNLVFYGDNTWLKLFPGMFHRSEGTTSFFVTDFTEVDDNVTRHINSELVHKKDWDVLILHYLGLDHIGHIHGPYDPLITKKLLEMDGIIKQIHSGIQKDDVIIMTGDHGMRDLGGHGGSTDSEIYVPFIVNKPCTKYRDYEIKQTDIAPTLSALLGVPLPAQSVGKIIHEFLPYENNLQFLYYLHYNALNLIKMDKKYREDFHHIFKKHIECLKNNLNPKRIIKLYEEKIIEISNELLTSSTQNQNVSFLYISICSLVLLMLQVGITFYVSNFFVVLLLNIFRSAIVTNIYAFILTIISVKFCLNWFKRVKLPSNNMLRLLVYGTLFRTLFWMSSSYIEFEQYIWYFLWTTLCVYGSYTNYKSKNWNMFVWAGLAVCFRLGRNIHLLNRNIYWIVFITGLIGVSYTCYKFYKMNVYVTSCVLMIIFYYRLSNIIYVAQVTKWLILLTGVYKFYKHRDMQQSLIICWVLWMALLMRPQNVILLPLCLVTSHELFKLFGSIEAVTLGHIWLEEILFFIQGFDNNFSSVDISPGYVGLTEYNLLYTSLQVITHTYAFRVLVILLLTSRNSDLGKKHKIKLYIYMLYRLISLSFYCFVIFIHRHHLFIWSVFSPKLLIESCHSVCFFLLLLYFSCVNILNT